MEVEFVLQREDVLALFDYSCKGNGRKTESVLIFVGFLNLLSGLFVIWAHLFIGCLLILVGIVPVFQFLKTCLFRYWSRQALLKSLDRKGGAEGSTARPALVVLGAGRNLVQNRIRNRHHILGRYREDCYLPGAVSVLLFYHVSIFGSPASFSQ